jgi:predicted Zn-dependent protease
LVLPLTWAFGHGGLHERLAQLAADLEKNPNDARLYFELADVNCQHGEWQASLLNLDRVDELAPGKYLTGLLRGDAWLTGGQPEKAKKALDSLLGAHPECARGWLLRARAAQRLGDGPGSVADYREALARTVVWEPDLVCETADALVSQGCGKEAAQVLAAAIGKLGNVPALVQRSLEREIAAKDFDAALRRVEALRQTAPRPEPWMARRASVLAQAGRIEESRAAWQALLDHLAALPNLQRGSHSMSKLAEEARFALSSLDSLSPQVPPASAAAPQRIPPPQVHP